MRRRFGRSIKIIRTRKTLRKTPRKTWPEHVYKFIGAFIIIALLTGTLRYLPKRVNDSEHDNVNDNVNDSVNDSVNDNYLYKDDDIDAILKCKLLECKLSKNYHIMAPIIDDRKQKYSLKNLIEECLKHDGQNYFIIPYNIGNSHWVGIIVEIERQLMDKPVIKKIEYLDSMNGKIPNIVTETFKNFTSIKINNNREIYNQNDSTSCGPYTIENIILALTNKKPDKNLTPADIRLKHIKLLHSCKPEF